MKKATFLTIAYVTACFSVFAQTGKITGLVTFGNERQSGVTIKNLTHHRQTQSNDIGEFELPALASDTLAIIKAGYKNDTLTVTAIPYMIIKLKREELLLKEVIISSTAITPEKTYEQNKKDYKDIYWKGDKSHMVVITPLGVGANVDKIYNALSKEGKDARKMQRRLDTDYRYNVIDRRFSKALVSRVTGYKAAQLADFMDKYRPSFEMARKYTDYELIRYIKLCMVKNKKNG